MIPILCITAFMIAGESTGFIGYPVKIVSLASLACISAYLFAMLKKGDASPVLKTMVVFLVLETVGVWTLPQESRIVFGKLSVARLYALFVMMALFPLLIGGTPFTTFFARKDAPEEVWETDIFKKINRTMTWVWVVLFVLCCESALVPILFPPMAAMPWNLVFRLVLPALLLLGPGRMFNKKYPGYHMRKIGLAPAETDVPE